MLCHFRIGQRPFLLKNRHRKFLGRKMHSQTRRQENYSRIETQL